MSFARRLRRRYGNVPIAGVVHAEGVEHEGRVLIRGRCPYCRAVVLLDEERRITSHQRPTCTGWDDLMQGAKLLGEQLLPGGDPRGEA